MKSPQGSMRGASASDTIAAIASPPGGGERGILRLSGVDARRIVRAVWAHATVPDLGARALFLGRFRDSLGTQPLLLLWMPAPHSFTREDVAEFHLPGSPPLLQAALARLIELGAVLARPGEFTRRAFEAGRIDLTRAEGVLALVRAHNESEARAARALLFGGLGDRVAAVRDALAELRALCEASLDFDESDTGHVPAQEMEARARAIDADLSLALDFERARATRTGVPRVCLAGAPNAGKSCLFNALVGRERAIVSAEPGTTRDALVAQIEIGGRALELADTAGLDDPSFGPDRSAQVVARGVRDSADVIVWVVDATRAPFEIDACSDVASDATRGARSDSSRAGWLASLRAERAELAPRVPVVLAWNKIDVRPGPPPQIPAELDVAGVVSVCARNGLGLPDLRRIILAALEPMSSEGGVERDLALRHVLGLESARRELFRARSSLLAATPLELVAEHLRHATAALDDLAGTTTPEDILDRIFSRFCLGK